MQIRIKALENQVATMALATDIREAKISKKDKGFAGGMAVLLVLIFLI